MAAAVRAALREGVACQLSDCVAADVQRAQLRERERQLRELVELRICTQNTRPRATGRTRRKHLKGALPAVSSVPRASREDVPRARGHSFFEQSLAHALRAVRLAPLRFSAPVFEAVSTCFSTELAAPILLPQPPILLPSAQRGGLLVSPQFDLRCQRS